MSPGLGCLKRKAKPRPEMTEGYLCRDQCSEGWVAFFQLKKPQQVDGEWISGVTYIKTWTPEEFQDVYGFIPRKGSCHWYEIEL